MKLVTVVISGISVKSGTSKAGNPYTLYYFSGHETDLTGSRIPCEIITGDGVVRDKLTQYVNKDEIQVPFTRADVFAGKPQYNVDNVLILHSEFDLVR